MAEFDVCEDCAPANCTHGFSNMSTVFFIFLCSICGFLATGGNLALLIAFSHSETIRKRANIYFILSLTVADMVIGLTMTPLYICYATIHDPYALWLVKLEGFLWIVTVTATTHSLSAVSLDRLISVLYPLRYHQIMTKKRCRVVVLLIWLGSVIFGLPRLVLNDFVKLEKLWIACSVATVGIPLLVMSLSYGRIFAIVRKQSGKWKNPNASRDTLGNKKAAVTIDIIVCLFVVTFIPSAVVYFMLLFEDNLCKEYQLNDVWLWAALVSFCHSSFNPWVYGFRYRELRKDFMALFWKNCNMIPGQHQQTG